MTIYSEMLGIFPEHGISDEKALANFLNRNKESGYVDSRDWNQPQESSLGAEICAKLAKIAERLESIYETSGIQQFSLSVEPRVKEDDVRKALFLSQTATIFTQHKFSYNKEALESLDDDPGDRYGWYWNLSHDFLRDVFRYREAIGRNLLVILPSTVDYYGSSVDLTLLKELENTKVIQVRADSQLIEAIVARYKMQHQLISLPDLAVPWIKGLNLSAILKIRDDYSDSIDTFQRAYHQCVMAHIENHKSLDFARISRQINQDLITPQIKKIEKDYKRAISHHRSLALTGAAVAVINIVGVVVSGALLNRILTSDVVQLLPSAIAGLLATFAINKIELKRAVQELEDEEFYVLWKIKREQ